MFGELLKDGSIWRDKSAFFRGFFLSLYCSNDSIENSSATGKCISFKTISEGYHSLLLFAITVVCYVVIWGTLSDDYGNMTGRTEMGVLVVGLVGSFAGYCLNLRRMQDIGSVHSKKIALAILAIDVLFCFDISESLSTILGVISLPVALYMLFFPGTVGPNEYGPDPLEPQIASDISDIGAGNDMQGDPKIPQEF